MVRQVCLSPLFLWASNLGGVLDQQKDVSLFLDETGLPAAPHRDLSRLKNKDTSFC